MVRQSSLNALEATAKFGHSLPTALDASAVPACRIVHGVELTVVVPPLGCVQPQTEVDDAISSVSTAAIPALPRRMPDPGRGCASTSWPFACDSPHPTAAASGAPMTVMASIATDVHAIAGPQRSRAPRPSTAARQSDVASAPAIPTSSHKTRSDVCSPLPPMSMTAAVMIVATPNATPTHRTIETHDARPPLRSSCVPHAGIGVYAPCAGAGVATGACGAAYAAGVYGEGVGGGGVYAGAGAVYAGYGVAGGGVYAGGAGADGGAGVIGATYVGVGG